VQTKQSITNSKLTEADVIRYSVAFLSIILFIAFLLRCGGDPIAEGDKAYAAGDYNAALKSYFEAKKSQPDNQAIREKIALAYTRRGLSLFEKTKNLNTFIGNHEKALDYVPERGASEAFKKEYSKLLFKLAQAYKSTKAENPIQEEQYFSKTLDNLNEAIALDDQNMAADSMLQALRRDNFQKMFDKGETFYIQAQKEKNNPELYLSAEFYIDRAVSFDPSSEKAQKYMKKVREKTLKILDLKKDLPLAVANMKRTKSHTLLDITVFNNMGEKIMFDPMKLKIIDIDNNEHAIDVKETDKYDRALTKPVEMEPRKQVDGNVAFNINKSTQLLCLQYELSDGKVTRKYFP
ncbi:MAG: DUF4352 domain-containing protein, partial [Calditrichaceae bacterium]